MNEHHEAAIRTYDAFQKGMRAVKDLHRRVSTDLDETSIQELQDLHTFLGSSHALLGVVLVMRMKGVRLTAGTAKRTDDATKSNPEESPSPSESTC